MTWLVTSDIHLSDRARDSYRFGIFKWLAEQQKRYSVTATFILGDLTQEKDNHSANLVNRTIDEMTRLRPPVYLLRGNHDGISPDNPFFRFTGCIYGFNFIGEPYFDPDLMVALVPHYRTQQEFDDAVRGLKAHKAIVMVHQTFEGAVAESGVKLSGLSTKALAATKPLLVLAGDVHRPQDQGIVTYVGAPYHVRFGDDYEARVLLIRDDTIKDLHFEAPRKWSLHPNAPMAPFTPRVRKGDHVKVTLMLNREDAVNWHKYRRDALSICHEHGVEVYGIDMQIKGDEIKNKNHQRRELQTPEQVFTAFCGHEGIKNGLRDTGFKLLTTAKEEKGVVTRR